MSGRRRAAAGFDELPDAQPSHRIGRVTILRGANQCDVELDDKETHLILIPTKFHKVVWIKRGDFVIIDVYPATKTEHKVRGEIVQVLNPLLIKELKKQKRWPAEFDSNVSESKNNTRAFDLPPSESEEEEEEDGEAVDGSDDDLPANPNRRVVEVNSDDEDKPRPPRRRYRGYVPSDEEDDEWDSEDEEDDEYDSEDD